MWSRGALMVKPSLFSLTSYCPAPPLPVPTLREEALEPLDSSISWRSPDGRCGLGLGELRRSWDLCPGAVSERNLPPVPELYSRAARQPSPSHLLCSALPPWPPLHLTDQDSGRECELEEIWRHVSRAGVRAAASVGGRASDDVAASPRAPDWLPASWPRLSSPPPVPPPSPPFFSSLLQPHPGLSLSMSSISLAPSPRPPPLPGAFRDPTSRSPALARTSLHKGSRIQDREGHAEHCPTHAHCPQPSSPQSPRSPNPLS